MDYYSLGANTRRAPILNPTNTEVWPEQWSEELVQGHQRKTKKSKLWNHDLNLSIVFVPYRRNTLHHASAPFKHIQPNDAQQECSLICGPHDLKNKPIEPEISVSMQHVNECRSGDPTLHNVTCHNFKWKGKSLSQDPVWIHAAPD